MFFTLVQQESTNSSYSKLDLGLLSGTISSLANRIVNSWNFLPSDVVSASSVSAFKKHLDDFWAETRYGHTQRPAAYNL